MPDPNLSRNLEAALNKVAKWRSVLAGWQLGTRSKDDPESQAVRDTRELLILLRVEVSALTNTLLDAGVIDHASFLGRLTDEALALDKAYETKFPGARTSEAGVHIDIAEAQGWLRAFRP